MRKVIVIVVVAVSGAIWLSFGVGRSAQPEAPGLATPATMTLTAPLGLQLGLPYIPWEPIDGAAGYRLTGEIHMVRVNRDDPFCTLPVEEGTQTLSLDDKLPISPKVDHVDLPVLELPPEDAWFFFDVQVNIQALDDDANVIAAAGSRGIAETLRDCSTPTPVIILPETGFGGGAGGGYALTAALAAGFAGAAATALAALLARWQRTR